MSALSAMQDKTQHLENSLSAETRIKLDLFSALGDAKRQLEIAQGQPDFHKQHIYSHTTLRTYKYFRVWTIFSKLPCVWADALMSVFRSDPAEGPGDKRSEAEDSRSDGRHAQHLLHSRHQQHDPRGPPLLLQVYGHQSLRPRPQRLRLPATQKVNASSRLPSSLHPPIIFFFFFFFPAGPPPSNLLGMSAAENVVFLGFLFFSSPGQKDVVLCDCICCS